MSRGRRSRLHSDLSMQGGPPPPLGPALFSGTLQGLPEVILEERAKCKRASGADPGFVQLGGGGRGLHVCEKIRKEEDNA